MSLWTAVRDYFVPPFRGYSLCKIGPDCDLAVDIVTEGGRAHLTVASNRGLPSDGASYSDNALYYSGSLLPKLAEQGYRFPPTLSAELQRAAGRAERFIVA